MAAFSMDSPSPSPEMSFESSVILVLIADIRPPTRLCDLNSTFASNLKFLFTGGACLPFVGMDANRIFVLDVASRATNNAPL